jgi:teichuronic acid exporter
MRLAKRRLIGAVPWAGFEATAGAAISAVSLVTIVAVIGPEAFGRATLAMVTAGVIEGALAGGLFDAVVRARSSHTRLIDTIFWTRLTLGMVAGLCSFAAGPVLAWIYADPELGSLLSVYATTCLLNALAETPSAFLTRRYRFRRLATVAIAARLAGLVVGVASAFGGLGSWSLIASALSTNGLAAVLFWAMAPRLPRFRIEANEIGPILRFSYLVGAENVLVLLAARGVFFFLGYFHGLQELGYFNFGLRLVEEVGGVLGRVAWKSAFPYFSELNRRGESLGSAFARTTAIYTCAAYPALAGIACVAADLVPFAFGVKWLPAVAIVQIVAIASAITTSAVLAGPLLRTTGKQAALVGIAALDTIIALGATIATANTDMVAATMAWSVKAAIIAPILISIVVRETGMRVAEFFRSIAPAAAATLVMIFALRQIGFATLDLPHYARIVLHVTAGVVIYASALLALDWRVRSYVFTQLRDRPGRRNLRHDGFGGPAEASEAVD